VKAILAGVLGLVVARAAPAADPVEKDWYMVVLRADAKPEALEGLERRLRTRHGVGRSMPMTQGAVMGLRIWLDPDREAGVRAEPSVASLVRVARPGAAPPSQPSDRFQRGLPGWAIPGLYSVVMHDKWGFGLELPLEQRALTGVARREALRERRERLIREAAEALAGDYGGAVRSLGYGGEPRFSCAMVEGSARRMAEDPRVWRVFEEGYGVIDDPPAEEAPVRPPLPAPSPWRP
jgi:hypothetical protein